MPRAPRAARLRPSADSGARGPLEPFGRQAASSTGWRSRSRSPPPPSQLLPLPVSLLYTHSLPTRKPYGGTAPSSSRPPGPPPCAAPPRRRARRARPRRWSHLADSVRAADGGSRALTAPRAARKRRAAALVGMIRPVSGACSSPSRAARPTTRADALPFTPGGEDDSESVGEESGAPAPRLLAPARGGAGRAREVCLRSARSSQPSSSAPAPPSAPRRPAARAAPRAAVVRRPPPPWRQNLRGPTAPRRGLCHCRGRAPPRARAPAALAPLS